MKEIRLSKQAIVSDQNQEFIGWGTSLSWWANVIGGWENQKHKQEICDLLFSAEKGLGINIVRYNFGAGDPNEIPPNFRVGANIESYGLKPGVWDMTRDAGQRWILFEAVKRGVNVTEGFFNSPPIWMLQDRSTAGASYGQDNLRQSEEINFVEYMVELLCRFEQTYDFRFDSLSVFNEPSSMWWQSDNDQEGCHYSLASQAQILLALSQRIASKDLYSIKVSGPEGWSIFESVSMYNDLPEPTRKCLDQINSHTYAADNRARKALCRLAERDDKPLWMSEVCLAVDGKQEPEAVETGLLIARAVIDDLKYLKPEAWVYWQAVENKNLDHNYGFIQATYDEREEYTITRSYYVFKQFSRHIRPGMRLVDLEVEDAVAAYDSVYHRLIIICLNQTSQTKNCHFEVEPKIDWIEATVTSANQIAEKQTVVIQKQSLSFDQPTQSVVTLVIKLEEE